MSKLGEIVKFLIESNRKNEPDSPVFRTGAYTSTTFLSGRLLRTNNIDDV